MGVESDKLRSLVDDIYPNTVVNLTNALAATDAEITELTSQKVAVEWGMDQAKLDQETILATKGDLPYYYPNFGVLNLEEFTVYDLITTTNITYVSADSFTVDTDLTSEFTVGLEVLCSCGVDGDILRDVLSSSYDGVSDKTTVLLNDYSGTATPITPNLSNVYNLVYEYLGTGWDSDADIIANISYFENGYDHLNEPLGTGGTYGLNDKISKMTIGRNIQQSDKDKYESLIILYDRFAT